MGLPVPYYLSDPDYFPRNDPRREAHRAEIATQRKIDARIVASSGDQSYAIILTRGEMR